MSIKCVRTQQLFDPQTQGNRLHYNNEEQSTRVAIGMWQDGLGANKKSHAPKLSAASYTLLYI